MKNIKLGHARSFYMHRKIISWKKIKKILGISKAIRVFETPYYVFGNLSVLSIYSEVLEQSDVILWVDWCKNECFWKILTSIFQITNRAKTLKNVPCAQLNYAAMPWHGKGHILDRKVSVYHVNNFMTFLCSIRCMTASLGSLNLYHLGIRHFSQLLSLG